MMKRLLPLTLVLCSIALLGEAGALLAKHVRVIADVRTVSVPLVAGIPELEHRRALLSEQVELAELQSSLRLGSQEERVRTYVLPAQFDLDRIVALFDVFSLAIPADPAVASMSPLTTGAPEPAGDGLEAMPITVSFAVHDDGIRGLLDLFRLSGMLTVADALSEEEMAALLASVEAENPAGIVPLEQFLSADLLEYAQNPKLWEERLRRSFLQSGVQQAIDTALQTSLLRNAKEFLGGRAGFLLSEQQLWPLPLFTIDGVHASQGRAPGWYTLTVTLRTYRRSAA